MIYNIAYGLGNEYFMTEMKEDDICVEIVNAAVMNYV
jgi:hypothetical protein